MLPAFLVQEVGQKQVAERSCVVFLAYSFLELSFVPWETRAWCRALGAGGHRLDALLRQNRNRRRKHR